MRIPGSAHPVGSVEQADPYLVRAHFRHAGIHDLPGLSGRAPQIPQEIGSRAPRAEAVILEFQHRDDMRPGPRHRGGQPPALPFELSRGFRAPCGREATALAIAVEVVVQVEGHDAHVARRRRRNGGKPGRRGIEIIGKQQLGLPAVMSQHAFHAQDAGPDREGLPHRIREADGHGALLVQPPLFTRIGTRPGDLGGRRQGAICADQEFPATQAIHARDRQRLLETDPHALGSFLLQVGHGQAPGCERQPDSGRAASC